MNGAILGFHKEEMDARFSQIAEFAGIGEFIERPVKTYSSGMFMRLAMAVATSVEPDILIIDEALAVGDEAFQRKCFARIEQIKERGGTILFVSHGAQAIVQFCDRAILIDGGEKLLEGTPKLVVGHYQRLLNARAEDAAVIRHELRALGLVFEEPGVAIENSPANEDDLDKVESEDNSLEGFDASLISQTRVDIGDGSVEISNVRIENKIGNTVNVLISGHRYCFCYDVLFKKNANDILFGMLIKTVHGIELGGSSTFHQLGVRYSFVEGERLAVRLDFDCRLAAGSYFANAGASTQETGELIYLHRILDALAFRVMSPAPATFTGAVDFRIHPSIQP